MTRQLRRVLVLASLLGAMLLATTTTASAGAPSGYDCGKGGKPKAGKGCKCPKGKVSGRDGKNKAICKKKPDPKIILTEDTTVKDTTVTDTTVADTTVADTTVADTTVTDTTLSSAQVKSGVKRVLGRMHACGAKYPDAKGTVKLRVTVNAAGGTPSAVTVASSPDPDLGTCVATEMKRASFASAQEDTAFSYPMVFK